MPRDLRLEGWGVWQLPGPPKGPLKEPLLRFFIVGSESILEGSWGGAGRGLGFTGVGNLGLRALGGLGCWNFEISTQHVGTRPQSTNPLL